MCIGELPVGVAFRLTKRYKRLTSYIFFLKKRMRKRSDKQMSRDERVLLMTFCKNFS